MLKPLVFICVAVIATVAVSLAWTAIGGGPLGLHGLIALSLGVLGTVGLTWALMALAFKSSREGWDERPDNPDRP
jgi:cation transporter-like permease